MLRPTSRRHAPSGGPSPLRSRAQMHSVRPHRRRMRPIGRRHGGEHGAVRVRVVGRARPHRRRTELDGGHKHRAVRLVGARRSYRRHRRLLPRAYVHAPRRLPHGSEHSEALHGPPCQGAARILRHTCFGSLAPANRWRCRADGDAARTQPRRHYGNHRDVRRAARAVARLRLAYGRGVPARGHYLHRSALCHDGWQERESYGRVLRRLGPRKQGGDRVRTRHTRGQSVPANGVQLPRIQGCNRRLLKQGLLLSG